MRSRRHRKMVLIVKLVVSKKNPRIVLTYAFCCKNDIYAIWVEIEIAKIDIT